MLRTFIPVDSLEKTLFNPQILPKEKRKTVANTSTTKTPPKRKPRNTSKKKPNSSKQNDEAKPFKILLLFPLSFFSPTLCGASSKTEWFPSEDSEFLSTHAEYLFSFDMLLSVGVLGWFLFLWVSHQVVFSSDAVTNVLSRRKSQVKSGLKLKIDSKGWQNLRRKLFMSPSPYVEVHKIYRGTKY